VYVDDLLLAGPKDAHDAFWDKLKTKVEIDDVTPISRFLGRQHDITRTDSGGEVVYNMSEYAEQCVKMYSDLTGVTKFKRAATPFLPDGSFPPADDDETGEVATHACALVMKKLWLARLARPDIIKAINVLSSKIQKWTRNDDKRLYRLICYLHWTVQYGLKGTIGDPPEDLELSLFVDADFAGDKEDSKSTSGVFLVLTGPNTYFPLTWATARQTCTSRSTTEAEIVALALGMFNEAIPASILWSLILGRDIKVRIFEDNQAAITVVKKGFSKKLRYISRTHKVNISSLKEVCVTDQNSDLAYIETSKQAADIFTKSLSPSLWNAALDMLGIQKNESLLPQEDEAPSSKP
jgi:hypothetical protein